MATNFFNHRKFITWYLPITYGALYVYNSGPNWMSNESVPKAYYRSCGFAAWFDWLYHAVPWIMENGTWIAENPQYCSIGFYLASQKWSYECLANSLIYGAKRSLGETPQDAFKHLMFHFQLIFAIMGIINFIIMTRVIKQIEANGSSDTLLLHQTEIACDILMVIKSHIPWPELVNALKYAVTGNQSGTVY